MPAPASESGGADGGRAGRLSGGAIPEITGPYPWGMVTFGSCHGPSRPLHGGGPPAAPQTAAAVATPSAYDGVEDTPIGLVLFEQGEHINGGGSQKQEILDVVQDFAPNSTSKYRGAN